MTTTSTDDPVQVAPHRPATVLVTGGRGYLAGWIIAGLLQRGHTVRTTVRAAAHADTVRSAMSEQVGRARATTIEAAVADLVDDAGWDDALGGVDYVIHTASPLGFNPGVDLVRVAREGVARVLGAAARANVQRVVYTSSGVAAVPEDTALPATESIWAAPTNTKVQRYNDSKILAEHDAWDLAASTGLELATVLPTFMQGPMLGAPNTEGSVEIIRRMLAGKIPALPHVGWDIVDVRDIAELHLLAMTHPAAAGQRFLGSNKFLWWHDLAQMLRHQVPDLAGDVTIRSMPDAVAKLLARFNPQMAMLVPNLRRHVSVDSSKARTQLGWRTRRSEVTITDTARALAEPRSR